MKRIYITFGGAAYDEHTALTVRDAPAFGADEVWVYDDVWLVAHDYYKLNRWLFQQAVHGFGHCCWKPYVILDALRKADPGDVILYVDADTYPIADLRPAFAFAEREGIMLFEAQGCINSRWIRRDCFITMGLDREEAWHGQHACGRFQLFRVGDYVIEQMLSEWLVYSLNPTCQFWGPSKFSQDLPDFHRHSTEQAVLSLLAIKYAVPLHREACQFGWPVAPGKEDWYPQLFIQDGARGPDTGLGSRFRNV